MSPKLPQISGRDLIRILEKLGYEVIRQKGSNIRLRKTSGLGEHNITVPDHQVIAKGTLNDVISKVGLWNNMSKEELINLMTRK